MATNGYTELDTKESRKDYLLRYYRSEVAYLTVALEIARDWLDEVTNPDNDELATDEGVEVRKLVDNAILEGRKFIIQDDRA